MTKYGCIILAALLAGCEPSERVDVNYAFGGARTNAENATAAFLPDLAASVDAAGLSLIGLSQQLDFASGALSDVDPHHDIFWVWVGLNDYIAGATEGTTGPANISAAIERLYTEVGARRFVVPNLFDMSRVPIFQLFGADRVSAVAALTTDHNAALSQALAALAAQHPDATFVTVDVDGVFRDAWASGTFTNLTDGCLDAAQPCDGYFFVDVVHPTSAAMALVAAQAKTALRTAVPDLYVRRIITVGDSFSDTGSYFDTVERATGTGSPAPPFYDGRFCDGPNVIDQLEVQLDVGDKTTFFSQPTR